MNILKLRLTFILVTALALLAASCSDKKQQRPRPLPKIPVVKAQQEDVPIFVHFVGEISGQKDIPIRARVEGFLESIDFKEGSYVKKGQLLYTVDPQSLQERVNARRSEVAAAQTALAKAEADLKRIKPLADINAVSKSDLDAAQANYEAAIANLEAAKANLRSEQINLSYTRIYSPINGVIGKTNARVGEFVGREPNPVILNTVSAIDTIRVTFSLTEKQYLLIAKHRIKNQKSDTVKDPLRIILADGAVYQYPGYVDFIDRNINQSTGSMMVQATFPNPDRLLRPGMNCNVEVPGYVAKDALVIPYRSIVEMQGQYSVYVLDDSNKVVQKQLGNLERVGDLAIVQKGLHPGDRIVFEALQKVRPGMKVIPQDTVFQSKYRNQDN